jgi:peptidoglycan L-alanyl-D-glutamate endopeptidase CwlK
MFKFGKRSKKEMEGVHPDLIQVVTKALKLTQVDFGIIDGVRTKAEQELLVKKGASTTMKSKHLPQKDGYGHALDLVPYLNGKIRWEWSLFYEVAEAVFIAAEDHGVPLIWGGAWTELHEEYAHNLEEKYFPGAEFMQHRYILKKIKDKQKPFLDGPHFQLR